MSSVGQLEDEDDTRFSFWLKIICDCGLCGLYLSISLSTYHPHLIRIMSPSQRRRRRRRRAYGSIFRRWIFVLFSLRRHTRLVGSRSFAVLSFGGSSVDLLPMRFAACRMMTISRRGKERISSFTHKHTFSLLDVDEHLFACRTRHDWNCIRRRR